MNQLEKLKRLLNEQENDELLELYLEDAKNIICELRYTYEVEPQYLTTQLKIAMELYSKSGAEGQTSHSENGISRTYEAADISPSLLSNITPFVRTPFSKRRVVEY
mgnify:CR=1 FL=1